jgi:hypothetical protein
MHEYKYLTGSKMLKLENNRDEDWITFVAADSKIAQKKGCHSIAFYQTILKHFIGGINIAADPYKALYLYQLSNGFIVDEEYPFKDFNILEHKEVWVKWLKAYINAKSSEDWATKTEVLPKQFYHLLYQYYMIKENTHWISDEAKAEVQKIHDLEMPSSYFEELKALINSL